MTTSKTGPSPEVTAEGRRGGGCLLLAVLVTVGVCVVSYGFWQIWSTVSDFEDRYLDAGYALKEGTTVTITEPILENTYLYARETLRIEAGAHASLALSAHEAFIAGTVTGDVAFLGGDLEISDGAIIEGMLDVTMARNVVVRGRVVGGIKGTWTRLYELQQGPDSGEGTTSEAPQATSD